MQFKKKAETITFVNERHSYLVYSSIYAAICITIQHRFNLWLMFKK